MPPLYFETSKNFMKEIESREAWDLLQNQNNAILVDVRTQQEWNENHADISSMNKSAFLVTISNDFDSFIQRLEDIATLKEAPSLFFCRSGARSRLAAELAEKNGYTETYNVSGGIIKWIEDGLPYSNAGERNA